MQWRRVALAVLLVLAGYGLVAPLDAPLDHGHGTMALPTDHEYDPFASATALARGADGTWWHLERTLEYPIEGAVYQHGPDWTPTGARHGISLPEIARNETVRPMDISQRADGSWAVLGENSAVYLFDRNWTDTGRRIVLPSGTDWPNGTAHSFDRTPDGWWVDAYGRLTLYDADFSSIRASYGGYDDLGLGQAYYNEHYEYMTVGDVHTIFADDGDLVLETSLADHFYRFDGVGPQGLASTTPAARFSPDAQPPHVTDIAGGSDGRRYLVRADGTVYEYTESWLYTGTARVVGSGSAVDRYPSDVVSMAPLIGAVGGAIARLLPAAYLLIALAVVRRRERAADTVYAGSVGSGVLAYGLFFEPSPLRPALLWNRFVLVGGLLAIGVGVGYHVAIEREDRIALVAVYAPVVYAVATIVARLVG